MIEFTTIKYNQNNKNSTLILPANGFYSQMYKDYCPNGYNLHLANYDTNYKHTRISLWHDLANSLDTFCAKFKNDFILIGHSMGANISLLAKSNNIRSMILLDPVFLKKRLYYYFKVCPEFILKKHGFIKKTLRRKSVFKKESSICSYLNHNKLFKNFTSEKLSLYKNLGFTQNKDSYLLKYNTKFEAMIYYSMFDILPLILKKHKKIHLIYGKSSAFYNSSLIQKLSLTTNIYSLDGGHLFPFENTIATQSILNKIFIEYMA